MGVSHRPFPDLLDDWSSSQPPDLLRFAPCTWSFQMLFKEFELITLTNAGNWIDCSSQSQENGTLRVGWKDMEVGGCRGKIQCGGGFVGPRQ